MQISKISSNTNFKARLNAPLQLTHQNSLKTEEDRKKSEELQERLANILPDYTIRAYKPSSSNSYALCLEKCNKAARKFHSIALYKKIGDSTMKIDDVKIENMEKLFNKLESIYGNQEPIADEMLVVNNDTISSNPYAMEIMKEFEKRLVGLEFSSILKYPYSVEISKAQDEGKILKLTQRDDDIEDMPQVLTVKENLKLTLRTKDFNDNIITLTSTFYMPEDINPDDDVDFWAKNLEKTTLNMLFNAYPESSQTLY